MDYNKLKRQAQISGVMLQELASVSEMTLTGFKISYENGTYPIRKVVDLCKSLGISPNELFDFPTARTENLTIQQTGGIGNQQTNITSSIAALERQLEEKDKQIQTLLEIVKTK